MGDVDRARAAGRTNAGPAGRGNDHGGPHGVPNARPVFTAPLVRGPGSPGDSRRTTGAPGRHECEAAWGTEQRRGSKTRDRRRQAIDDSLEPVVEARVCASRPTDPAIVECLTAAGRVPQAHVRVTAVGKAEHRCGAHVEGAAKCARWLAQIDLADLGGKCLGLSGVQPCGAHQATAAGQAAANVGPITADDPGRWAGRDEGRAQNGVDNVGVPRVRRYAASGDTDGQRRGVRSEPGAPIRHSASHQNRAAGHSGSDLGAKAHAAHSRGGQVGSSLPSGWLTTAPSSSASRRRCASSGQPAGSGWRP